ncbi:unnamed protein product [Echinostoma caproni]|uniref:Expressed conserved protein n=1 Tax=Echinostoma caproni TaxID=27848 RepID=A0A183A645_9TREM|nr:unnamed protein product [Echinostoma caproni]
MSIHGSSSGCSSGSSAESQVSASAIGCIEKAEDYGHLHSAWTTWCPTPRQNVDQIHPQVFSKEMSQRAPYVRIPVNLDFSRASPPKSRMVDAVSLVSDTDVIDPVYSKIRSSSFGDLVPCDYDSVIDSDEWDVPAQEPQGSNKHVSSDYSGYNPDQNQQLSTDMLPKHNPVLSLQIDLLDVKSTPCIDTLDKYPVVKSNSPSEIYSAYPPQCAFSSEPRRVKGDLYSSPERVLPRKIASSSPARSLITSAQTRTLMSPLMERSMEDEEVRYVLSQPSRL